MGLPLGYQWASLWNFNEPPLELSKGPPLGLSMGLPPGPQWASLWALNGPPIGPSMGLPLWSLNGRPWLSIGHALGPAMGQIFAKGMFGILSQNFVTRIGPHMS